MRESPRNCLGAAHTSRASAMGNEASRQGGGGPTPGGPPQLQSQQSASPGTKPVLTVKQQVQRQQYESGCPLRRRSLRCPARLRASPPVRALTCTRAPHCHAPPSPPQ